MRILGIETSCDETGVAIYDKYKGLLINQLYSQAKLHANYGGVVPELASRDHIRKIIPLIQLAMLKAKLEAKDINGVAYTAGPGLSGSLIVGATVGRTLAYAWQLPAIGIHHMEGHLLAPMLESNPPKFPFLALLISGGHTQLLKVKNIGNYQLLGETVDDAVGEAFDKVAKLLGIDYPGGSILSDIAQNGISGRYNFPRPMINKPGFNFSFSGLKTSVANTIYANPNDNQTRADIARGFEDAVVETLAIKCHRALNKTKLCRLVISGGVSANRTLRLYLNKMMHSLGGQLYCAKPEFCTDNGAMIAYTGMVRLQEIKNCYNSNNNDNLTILVRPRWNLNELSVINNY